MTPLLFALVDCNNFYVSCERVFNPKLENLPVITLSSNDGCVISRSNEAKVLGIPMGIPVFQVRQIIEKHDIKVFSSNFALYGDMSQRVMETLTQFTPEIEVYSIDEAFLNLGGFEEYRDLTEYGREIATTVRRWTGIPVSVGIAETKTLSKIASWIAKTSKKAHGVVNLSNSDYQEEALSRVPVGKVWGIGRQYAKLLNEDGVETALQLRDLNDDWIRNQMGIVGLRLVNELRGIACLALEDVVQPQKSMVTSRTFSHDVKSLEELAESISTFTVMVAKRLRDHKQTCKLLTIFIRTNQFRNKEDQYRNSAVVELRIATNDTGELLQASQQALKRIYRKGFNYKQAGVMLTGLAPADYVQGDLFDTKDRVRSEKLMSALDQIDAKMGVGAIQYASEGIEKTWKPDFTRRSPHYTTSWDSLASVKAD